MQKDFEFRMNTKKDREKVLKTSTVPALGERVPEYVESPP